MLNFTQKIVDNFSNQVSTQLFTGSSHLFMPIVSREKSINGSKLPKSIFLAETELSIQSHIQTESDVEENLAKSRRSKESIELKRQIIRKMNQKILDLQKKSKNQKMDIFELQAYKNDLLSDFLEYQQSKRKHQEELTQRQDELNQDEKSFFFMKNELQKPQAEKRQKDSVNFIKKPSREMCPIQQKITDINLIPIQIYVPMIKMIDIEIPMLNFGGNKIRQTGTTSPTKFTKGSEEFYAGVSNQIDSVYDTEMEKNQDEQNLPLDSSLSKLLNQGRVLDLGTDRSEKSLSYRQGIGSDRYFIEEEDLINNLNERQQNYQNQKTQRKINENCQRQFQENFNKSFEKGRNRSFNSSLKDSILEDELKLNSLISEKQSSKYQQKRISIDNQSKDFLKNKILELKEELRQKAEIISDLLDKNNKFVREMEKMSHENERKERVIESANIKIQVLEEKIQDFEKFVKDAEQTAQANSNKLMNEIYQLSNQLQTKNQEISLMMDSMQVMERNSYNKQKVLMKDIQNLQNTVHKMREEIQYYKKRFQEEGIKLNFTEIQMIQEAIEDREKMYETNLEKLKGIYESEISQLKKKFSTLEQNTKELHEKNHHSSVETESKTKTIVESPVIAVKEEQIREIMDLYDLQLQSRDDEIIALKKELKHCKMALFQALELVHSSDEIERKSVSIECQNSKQDELRSQHDEMVIHILTDKNRALEDKLCQEMMNRKQMTQKLLKLEKLIQSDASQAYSNIVSNIQNQVPEELHENQHEYDLIEALTKELDTVMRQLRKEKQTSKKLRKQLNQQKPCSPTSESRQILALKQKITKLTKYTGLLQKQIRQIYRVDECEAHQKIIQRLQTQLKINPVYRSSQKLQLTQ